MDKWVHKFISPALGKIIFRCPDRSNLNWWAGQLKVAAAVTQLASSENPAAHWESTRQSEPRWQIKEECECWCANVISQPPDGAFMGEKQTSEGHCWNVLIEIVIWQKRFKKESSVSSDYSLVTAGNTHNTAKHYTTQHNSLNIFHPLQRRLNSPSGMIKGGLEKMWIFRIT